MKHSFRHVKQNVRPCDQILIWSRGLPGPVGPGPGAGPDLGPGPGPEIGPGSGSGHLYDDHYGIRSETDSNGSK